MNTQRSIALLALILVLAALGLAHSQSAQGQPKDQLGKVNFANSCGPRPELAQARSFLAANP